MQRIEIDSRSHHAISVLCETVIYETYLISGAMMIGPEQSAIKNRATRVALNMASARMEPACAVKDGMEDTAHYVRKIAIHVVSKKICYFIGLCKHAGKDAEQCNETLQKWIQR